MNFRVIIAIPAILFLLIIQVSFLYAQEGGESQTDSAPEVRALSPEQNRIIMDIRTSTLSELAAWARSLKLSEAGTSAELARRIRDYYNITEQAPAADDKRKIITIESAHTSEYFKIEVVDEEYARLTGEVKLSLKDGDAIHTISAWNILFNRTRNILTASGGVEYIKEEGDKKETFKGDSITVDIDNWSSVFLGGVSERSLLSDKDKTTYLFAGTVISRDEEEVTVLRKATISSANNPDSLWSLSASRVWLLPGSDFAIFNAVLKVGGVPVMYIPFFYYPADELIFHPVIGSRTREGPFIQTTTYILGRPKATSSTQSSLTKILGNSNEMEKRREGMFLRSTGKKKKDEEQISLKAMLDYYVNLGVYIGLDLSLPKYKVFKETNISATDISLGIGLTRTIALDNGNYTPFFPDYNGDSDWNHSSLFSTDVPFRYRFKAGDTISGKYFSFTWSLPYYSDPFVDSDFLRRSEEMDWVNMIQQGASSLDPQDLSTNQISHEPWQFSGQISPNFPNMAPYINSISIGTISSTIAFRTVDKRPPPNDIKYYSPSSWFFAPDTATLYQISASVSGVPLSLGGTASRTANKDTVEIEDPLKGIGIPRSPFEDRAKEEAPKRDASDRLVPPALTQRFDLPRLGTTRFSIDYRLSPQSNTTLRFDSRKWEDYTDISWSDISNIMSNFSGDASVNFILSHSEGLYSTTFNLSGNGTWRQYSYLNEDAKEYELSGGGPDRQRIANDRLQEARQSFFTMSYGTSTTIKPLYRNAIFGQSNLTYNLKGSAVKSKFVEKDMSGLTPAERTEFLEEWAGNPEWDMEWGGWDKEKISAHSLTANLSALLMEKTQSFTMTADLPPRDAKLRWETAINLWITSTSAGWGIQRPEEEDEWKMDPFTFREQFNFGSYGSLVFNFVMDTEGWDSPETGTMGKRVSSITTTLDLRRWGIMASFTASRMLGYEYRVGSTLAETGWFERSNVDDNKILRPKDFSLSFAKKIVLKEYMKYRPNKKFNNWIYNNLDFSFDIKTGVFINLQQYTSSNFTFSLGFTLEIKKFLSLSIAAESANARIYQYFHNWPGFRDAPIELPPNTQTNIFLDLIDSFRFDNEDLRKRSGFKMKSFRISATHHLGDWDAVLNWTIAPYRPSGSRQYQINNEVSFLLQWTPISEIKSDIKFDKSKNPQWEVKGL